MTNRTRFTAAEVIDARSQIVNLSVDQMLASGYIDIPAILNDHAKWEVVLEDPRDRKIQTIKEIRALTGLGLAESKHLADTPPSVILTDLEADEAKAAAKQIRDGANALVTVRRVPR